MRAPSDGCGCRDGTALQSLREPRCCWRAHQCGQLGCRLLEHWSELWLLPAAPQLHGGLQMCGSGTQKRGGRPGQLQRRGSCRVHVERSSAGQRDSGASTCRERNAARSAGRQQSTHELIAAPKQLAGQNPKRRVHLQSSTAHACSADSPVSCTRVQPPQQAPVAGGDGILVRVFGQLHSNTVHISSHNACRPMAAMLATSMLNGIVMPTGGALAQAIH